MENGVAVLIEEILDDGTKIPSIFLNQFLGLYIQDNPSREAPKDPRKTFQKLLDNAWHREPRFQDYYICDRWVFRIKDGYLVDILRIPVLTKHSLERIEKRFGWNTDDKWGIMLRVFYETHHGRVLSKQEALRLRWGKKRANDDVVLFENRVYVLAEGKLITVDSKEIDSSLEAAS